MDKIKYILFDWNGTLLDDLDMNIEIEYQLLKMRNLPADFSKEFYLENFGFPIIDFYKLVGFDFEKEKYEDVATQYAKVYSQKLNSATLFPDALPTIKALKENSKKLVIISATEHTLLLNQTEKFGISSFFEVILGNCNNLGISKVETAKEWLKNENASASQVLFIGDTVHDWETAKAIGCQCFLVSTGHNSKKRLLETGCEVFDSLEEICQKLL